MHEVDGEKKLFFDATAGAELGGTRKVDCSSRLPKPSPALPVSSSAPTFIRHDESAVSLSAPSAIALVIRPKHILPRHPL